MIGIIYNKVMNEVSGEVLVHFFEMPLKTFKASRLFQRRIILRQE